MITSSYNKLKTCKLVNGKDKTNTTQPFIVQRLLEEFGVSTRKIKKAIDTNAPILENDIKLDENHPSGEALHYNILSIKRYLTLNAWKKVNISCMYSLQFIY